MNFLRGKLTNKNRIGIFILAILLFWAKTMLAYYTEFDLLEWAGQFYGAEFEEYLQKNHKPVDVLYRLAEESSIVLLSGGGFQGPEWSIRISLANLSDEAYSKIGQVLHEILEQYVSEWRNLKIRKQ